MRSVRQALALAQALVVAVACCCLGCGGSQPKPKAPNSAVPVKGTVDTADDDG